MAEPPPQARTLVRPYVITGGRTGTNLPLPPEALVQATTDDPQVEAEPGALRASDITALRDRVSGPVYEPADEGFRTELVAAAQPVAVVGARDRGDVQVAVQFAAEHGLAVAVQSTGNGGRPDTDGALVINTRRMRQLAIDPHNRRARISAGVLWRDVLDGCAPYRMAPPCGPVPGVGAVGYTLCGGINPIGRACGYTADHVRSLEMVTADGRLRLVDASNDPELFWAVRGGDGNFGAVTAMEIDLVPESTLYGGGLYFHGRDAEPVLRGYLRWAPQLPESITTSLALLRDATGLQLPEATGGEPVVHLRVAHLGPVEQGAALLAPMRAAATPIADTVGPLPFTAIGDIHENATAAGNADRHGALLSGTTEDTATALLSAVEHARHSVRCVELHQLGGAFARQPAVPNAVGHRDAAYAVSVLSESAVAISPPGHVRVLDALAPWSTGGVPLDFLGVATDSREVAAAWDSATRQRLVDMKRAWDPANLFRFGHPLLTPPARVSPDARELLRRCHESTSVAELSAGLGLPLGVVRVLLTDLIEAGLVTIYRLDPERAGDTQLLEEVLHGLRSRL